MRWIATAPALGLALLIGAWPPAAANATTGGGARAADAAVAASRSAIGRQLGDFRFTDTTRRARSLADYRGRPLLVSLVYTGCTDACPLIVRNLHPAIEIAQEALGVDSFAVVTVGFDSRADTPERMRAFARRMGADLPNWDFLSADRATIDALADQLGFTFFPSSAGFDHMAQVSVVDAAGRVRAQVYGGAFEPPAIVEPLKGLVFSRDLPLASIDGLINRVRLFCTIYDPRSGRYTFDYSLFVGIFVGAGCLGLVGAVLVREWRRTRRAGRAA